LLNNQIASGAIPGAFIPAVEQGLREAVRRGVEGGFLVPDIRIDLVDGSYHDHDSSEAAFRIAAAMAFRDAVHNAGTNPGTSGDEYGSGVTEPRHPRPAPRESAVALPEPDDDRMDSDFKP
jgi:hypothetical protein